jgi:hypothetical protein
MIGALVFGGALAACSGGGGGGSQQAFCDELKKDKAVIENFQNQSDLPQEASFSAVAKAADALVAKAPAEIKSDMQKLDDGIKSLAKVLPELNSAASSSDFAKLASISSQFSNQNKDIETAANNVNKFAKDKCGIAISSDTASSSSSSDSFSLSDLSSLSNELSSLSNLSSLSDLSDFSSLSDLFSS